MIVEGSRSSTCRDGRKMQSADARSGPQFKRSIPTKQMNVGQTRGDRYSGAVSQVCLLHKEVAKAKGLLAMASDMRQGKPSVDLLTKWCYFSCLRKGARSCDRLSTSMTRLWKRLGP